MVWKASTAKPTLAPFADVGGYRVVHRPAPNALAQRVRQTIASRFKEQCPDRNGPVYRYDVGKDGEVLMTSCKVTSFDSWMLYFQHTRAKALKLLHFNVPILKMGQDGAPVTSFTIVGFESRARLKESDILQGRVVSQGAFKRRAKHGFRAEWIWQEGHGMVLHHYSVATYKNGQRVGETILHPSQAK